MKKILVASSILSANFAKLEKEIKKVEASGADWIHIDVMDGHFVPNITIGPLIVECVRKCTILPLDVHLMIEKPHSFVEQFIDAGSDIVTVHAEAYPLGVERKGISRRVKKIDEKRVIEVIRKIKSFGKKAGLSLNPDSPLCIQGVLKEVDMVLFMSVHPGFGGQKFIPAVLPKIKEIKKVFTGDIEVDGGINDENVKSVIAAGANIIVAGSYFFSSKDPKEAVRRLRGNINK